MLCGVGSVHSIAMFDVAIDNTLFRLVAPAREGIEAWQPDTTVAETPSGVLTAAASIGLDDSPIGKKLRTSETDKRLNVAFLLPEPLGKLICRPVLQIGGHRKTLSSIQRPYQLYRRFTTKL